MFDVVTGACVFVKLKIREIRTHHQALTAKGLTAALQRLWMKIGGIKPKLRQALPWTVLKGLPGRCNYPQYAASQKAKTRPNAPHGI